jgi:hypothetical protein
MVPQLVSWIIGKSLLNHRWNIDARAGLIQSHSASAESSRERIQEGRYDNRSDSGYRRKCFPERDLTATIALNLGPRGDNRRVDELRRWNHWAASTASADFGDRPTEQHNRDSGRQRTVQRHRDL